MVFNLEALATTVPHRNALHGDAMVVAWILPLLLGMPATSISKIVEVQFTAQRTQDRVCGIRLLRSDSNNAPDCIEEGLGLIRCQALRVKVKVPHHTNVRT